MESPDWVGPTVYVPLSRAELLRLIEAIDRGGPGHPLSVAGWHVSGWLKKTGALLRGRAMLVRAYNEWPDRPTGSSMLPDAIISEPPWRVERIAGRYAAIWEPVEDMAHIPHEGIIR